MLLTLVFFCLLMSFPSSSIEWSRNKKMFSQFRSLVNGRMESRVEIESLQAKKSRLDQAIQNVTNVYELITETSDIAAALRQKMTANKHVTGTMINKLLIDKYNFRTEQTDLLQRIQQIFHQLRLLKRRDPFCEENLPVEDMKYRWIILDNPEIIKPSEEKSNTKPRWEVETNVLEVGDLPACGSTTEPSLAGDDKKSTAAQITKTTLISQTNPTFTTRYDKPGSFVIVRGRRFDNGYVVTRLKFPTFNITGPSAAAGLVFKFRNAEEYGFVMLSVDSLTPSAEQIPALIKTGHINNGHLIVFDSTPTTINSSTYTLLGLQFTSRGLEVFMDGKLQSETIFPGPWTNEGTVGIFSSSGSVIFTQFTAGLNGAEASRMPFISVALGGMVGNGASLTRALSKQEYQAFIAQAAAHQVQSVSRLPETGAPIAKGKEEKVWNGPLCYDTMKEIPNLDDWEDAAALGWMVIDDVGEKRISQIVSATSESTNRALLLKNFACETATVSVRVRLEAASGGGLVFLDKGLDDRYIATIDSGFATVTLAHTIKGLPVPLQVAVMKEAEDSLLHSLMVKTDKKKNLIQVIKNI